MARYVFVTERVAYELPDKYEATNENVIDTLLDYQDLNENDRILGWTWNVIEVGDEEDVHELLEDWNGEHRIIGGCK